MVGRTSLCNKDVTDIDTVISVVGTCLSYEVGRLDLGGLGTDGKGAARAVFTVLSDK